MFTRKQVNLGDVLNVDNYFKVNRIDRPQYGVRVTSDVGDVISAFRVKRDAKVHVISVYESENDKRSAVRLLQVNDKLYWIDGGESYIRIPESAAFEVLHRTEGRIYVEFAANGVCGLFLCSNNCITMLIDSDEEFVRIDYSNGIFLCKCKPYAKNDRSYVIYQEDCFGSYDIPYLAPKDRGKVARYKGRFLYLKGNLRFIQFKKDILSVELITEEQINKYCTIYKITTEDGVFCYQLSMLYTSSKMFGPVDEIRFEKNFLNIYMYAIKDGIITHVFCIDDEGNQSCIRSVYGIRVENVTFENKDKSFCVSKKYFLLGSRLYDYNLNKCSETVPKEGFRIEGEYDELNASYAVKGYNQDKELIIAEFHKSWEGFDQCYDSKLCLLRFYRYGIDDDVVYRCVNSNEYFVVGADGKIKLAANCEKFSIIEGVSDGEPIKVYYLDDKSFRYHYYTVTGDIVKGFKLD